MFRDIAGRGVSALLVVSERDPGIDYVDRHAPEASQALRATPGFHRADLARADHTFTSRAAQRRVEAIVADRLLGRYV
jgi:hypothetical protein